MHPLDKLEDLNTYRDRFLDLALWGPYVQELLLRNGFDEEVPIRSGIPGTYPTFLAGNRAVVKLFGRLFNGWESFQTEREVIRLLAQDPLIPAPALLADGELRSPGASWFWPYLILEYLPGESVGELFPLLSDADRLQIAVRLGEIVRRLHSLPVPPGTVFGEGWSSYRLFLAERRLACVADQRRWNSLSSHLVDEIDIFLPPIDNLFNPTSQPHLIHADLTHDHLLGRIEKDGWTLVGIIDFGDAMIGSLSYELSALHLDLFRGELRYLQALLDAYEINPEARRRLPEKALACALMHRFDVFAGVFERQPALKQARSLAELAEALFGENESSDWCDRSHHYK